MFREDVAAYYRKRGYAIKENVKVRSPDGSVYAVDMVAQSNLGNLLIAFEDAGGFEGPEMNAVRRMAREIGATPVVAARNIPAGLRKQAAGAGVVLIDEDAIRAPEVDEIPLQSSGDPEYPPWPGTGKSEDGDDVTPWPRAHDRGASMEPRDVDSVVADLATDSVQRRRVKSTDPGIWSFPRQGADEGPVAPKEQAVTKPTPTSSEPGFGWLPKDGATDQEASGETATGTLRSHSTAGADLGHDRVAQRVDARTAHVRTAPAMAPSRQGVAPWIYVVMAMVFGATAAGVFYALSRLLG